MAAFSVAKAYNSTTQTITDNTATRLTLNSTETDPDGYRSGSTFTVPVGKGGVPFLLLGGTYSQSFNGGPVSAPTADLIMFYKVNGLAIRGGEQTRTSPYQTSNPGQPVGYISSPVTPIVLADGDTVELWIYIDNNGSSMTFGHASSIDAHTWFGLVRLAT